MEVRPVPEPWDVAAQEMMRETDPPALPPVVTHGWDRTLPDAEVPSVVLALATRKGET